MKKSKVLLTMIGALLGLAWLIPFYLMLTNSFKTKREIIEILRKY